MKVIKRKDKPFLVLRWCDPETGKTRERQTETNRRRLAEREAAQLETQLATNTVDAGELSWDRFRVRYEDERLAGLSSNYRGQWKTAANWLEKLHGSQVVRIGDIDASLLSRFQANLRKQGLPASTIASYLRPLRAALNWAESVGLLDRAPKINMPRKGRGGSKQMRSRAVTGEEFERIIAAIPKVRARDAKRWERFLRGLWDSGLRVSELLSLSWDPESSLYLDVSHQVPLIRMFSEGHKKGTDQYQPITPEFWELVNVPEQDRRGFVFPLPSPNGGQMTVKRVIRVIGSIGKAALVVTDAEKGKYATSHDIGRRPFTRRIARFLSQAELAEWMRHSSPATTMAYYHESKAEELAGRVWRAKGDPTGDPGQNSGQEATDATTAKHKLSKNLD